MKEILFKNVKTVDENWNVLTDMNVLVGDKRIRKIGKVIPENFHGEIIDGTKKLLMPGFYNTHCHLPMTLLRGHGQGEPLETWLFKKIIPMERKYTEEDLYYGALLAAMELLSSGVVSACDMYFMMPSYVKAYEEAGLKGNLTNGVLLFGENDSYFNDRSFTELLALDEFFKTTDGRIRSDVGIHSENTVTEKVLRETVDYALEHGKPIQMHLDETKTGHESFKASHEGVTPVKYMKKTGLLENHVTFAHCVHCEEEDLDILKESGCFLSHNISSNLKLGSGIAPVAEWFRKGMNVTFGTDGASSNNNLNYMEELHMAAVVASGISMDPNAVKPEEILMSASRTGALSQGRDDCGLMKEGMRADLVMFDLDKPHLTPDTETLSNIIYSAQASDVCLTMVDGKIVYRDGVFTGIDREKVLYEAGIRRIRLMKEAGFA